MPCWQVAELLKSGASDEVLAETMVPIINSRFLQDHKPIPSNIAQDAKAMLNSPADILKPGVYGKGDLHNDACNAHMIALALQSAESIRHQG